jgi:hypothetical protein
MHTSSNIKVLIDTDGTPIIETCSKITFGSYNSSNEVQVQDFDAPQGARSESNWTPMNDAEKVDVTRLIASLARQTGITAREEVETHLHAAGLS